MPALTGRQYTAGCKLAHRLNIPIDQLLLVLEYGAAAFYGIYNKPKSGGGTRTIYVPYEPLKSIQQALLGIYFSDLPVSPIAHGCTAGRSIESNAFQHRKSHSMLGLDLRDAYNQVSFHGQFIHCEYTGFIRVTYGLLGRLSDPIHHECVERYYSCRKRPWDVLPMELAVLEIVSDLVEIPMNGKLVLPQGAPTSPALFNYACRKMDHRLEKFARNVGGVVTRFVDNITFSWEKERIERPIFFALRRIVEESGFKINEQKTFTVHNGNREGVPLRLPGVHICHGDLFIPRKKLRHLRMRLYCAGKSQNNALYQGLKGYAMQVEAQMPSQLRNVYGKARASNPQT